MGRDITKLHPKLQAKISELIFRCKQEGIDIVITECLRTVKEQNDLYDKGRTTGKKGDTVTNAKGTDYSSMHQWGIAFDFCLKEDVDKDGSTSDDAFNNKTGLFQQVGKIGKHIGLEWGGDWKSIKGDLAHFQLPDWGSTPSNLKKQFGIPEHFMKTWDTLNTTAPTKTASPTKKVLRVEVICKGLNLRKAPSWNDSAKSGKTVKKGDVFTVKSVMTVGSSKMYQLTSGYYISADEKYVKAYKE